MLSPWSATCPVSSTNGGPQPRLSSPPSGVLDLDDAGAEVAQHHRRVRAGERPGEVDDEDSARGDRSCRCSLSHAADRSPAAPQRPRSLASASSRIAAPSASLRRSFT